MLSQAKWNLFPNEHILGTEPPHHQQMLGLFRVVQRLQCSVVVVLHLIGMLFLWICQTQPSRNLQKH